MAFALWELASGNGFRFAVVPGAAVAGGVSVRRISPPRSEPPGCTSTHLDAPSALGDAPGTGAALGDGCTRESMRLADPDDGPRPRR